MARLSALDLRSLADAMESLGDGTTTGPIVVRSVTLGWTGDQESDPDRAFIEAQLRPSDDCWTVEVAG